MSHSVACIAYFVIKAIPTEQSPAQRRVPSTRPSSNTACKSYAPARGTAHSAFPVARPLLHLLTHHNATDTKRRRATTTFCYDTITLCCHWTAACTITVTALQARSSRADSSSTAVHGGVPQALRVSYGNRGLTHSRPPSVKMSSARITDSASGTAIASPEAGACATGNASLK